MSAWRGGRVLVGDEASLAVDRGLLLGDGLFETVLVVDGRAMFLDRHLARLTASAAALRFPLPPSLAETVDVALADLHVADGRPLRGALRVNATRGVGRGLTARAGAPGLVVTFEALPDEAATTPLKARVVAAPRIDPRDPLSGRKTLSRMPFVHARRVATDRGADVALLTTIDGDVAEADAANLFVVVDGSLVTPPLDRGVLPGITRARCLQLEKTVERTISVADLARAEEAFLTSSLDGVRPLAEIDERALGGPGVASLRMARGLSDAGGSGFRNSRGPHNRSR
jgi:branched-subunit amino acid aminotransferase/4-amino-4-deoxychorismate lyase